MRHAFTWLIAAALALATLAGTPPPAFAHGTKVSWKSVDVPAGADQDRRERALRAKLDEATRRADFGRAKSVAMTAKVVEFTSATRGDVHRVSCTLVARVVGGPTAKSRISFGGRPAERDAIEKQVLSMVASGVVGRLAEVVRARAAHEHEKARRPTARVEDPDEAPTAP